MSAKRILAAFTAAAVMSLAASATAGEAPNNDYQGRAERDRGTYVGFDLVRKNGEMRVTNLAALLSYHCGTDNPTFGAQSRGSIKVDSRKHFKGKLQIPLRARGSDATSAFYELSGKLGKHGKASGIIQGVVVFENVMRGLAPTGRCYTGGLRYTIKKGAEVSIPTPKSEGRLR